MSSEKRRYRVLRSCFPQDRNVRVGDMVEWVTESNNFFGELWCSKPGGSWTHLGSFSESGMTLMVLAGYLESVLPETLEREADATIEPTVTAMDVGNAVVPLVARNG